ncbi:MAG: NAD(P)H-flavin reductase [Glaciecola sp.]|jgi:aquacobalamin reductase/NAD(P)H-flavin reductase
MQTHQLHVDSITTVATNVYKILLSSNETLDYLAGQYCLIQMGEGDLRPFSIASAPSATNQIELHIGAVPENSYAWDVLVQMREQHVIQAQIGHGNAYLQPEPKRGIVLIAGGTGYSYVKSILVECIQQKLNQPISVYWGAKKLEQIYELSVLSALAEEHDNITFHPVLEGTNEHWQGKTGLVHKAVLDDFGDSLAEQQVYIAGPFPMAKVARDDYFAIGLNKNALFGDAYAFLD